MKETFRIAEIADLLGVSEFTVRKAIGAGRLVGRQVLPSRTAPFVVRRADLIDWMVKGGIPREQIRTWLYPGGQILLVGVGPPLQLQLRAGNPVAVRTLFEMGRRLERDRPWAVVVDLDEIGAAAVVASMAELGRAVDRPELIGLYGDDPNAPTRAAAGLFDVMLPKGAPPDQLARQILALKPGLTARG